MCYIVDFMLDIVAFDLNKTLIRENSWYDLNLAMGITAEEDELLYRLGPESEGILTYTEWIDILVRLMRARGKASRKNVERAILEFRYLDGAIDSVKVMQDRGFKVGLITGALSLIAEKVAKELNMDFMYCNSQMKFDANDMLQEIRLKGEDFAVKVEAVIDLRRRFPETREVYYVADGDTDEAIFQVTKSIMVSADQSLHEGWKRQALEEVQGLSTTRSARFAWRITDSIVKVPQLI